MSAQHFYHLCNRSKGRPVEIVTKHGKVYRGVIQHVDREKVYLRPFGRPGLGGYGYGFWGPGYGYRPGFGIGVALGVIGTLAFLPLFFW